uniref:Hypodermin-B n=1 Tax=Drosophila rhopaloa TaxID=1041015 RepID=A0A6P4FDE0_DRORH
MILPVALPLFLGLCVLVLSEDSEDSEMEVDKCDNTTIGGEPMDIKDAPWTASITVREKAKCVGVIYKLNYILTVAQCVDGYLNKAIRFTTMIRLVLPLLLVALPWTVFGDPDPQTRIIGGYSVDIKDAPYQAAVIVDSSAICSGAIIRTNTILTAASCVYDYSIDYIQVRVNTTSRNYDGTGVLMPVCGVTIHPQYSYWRYDFNLALLKLCEELKTSETVHPITVTDRLPPDDAWLWVTGWGSTSWWGSWFDRCFGSLPLQLQRAWVSVYNREQCAEDRAVWFYLWDNGISGYTLCTNYGAGGCSYDVGAPLVKDGYLVGILSDGGCTTKPDVYASVIWFQSWIDANTSPDPKGTTSGLVLHLLVLHLVLH